MKFYKNLSLKSKFLSLVIGFFIAFVIFLVLTILGEEKSSKATQEQIIAMLQQEIEAKIKLSTDSMASALGELVKGLDEKEQIQIISKAISKMYFEDDKSSYYFVYKEGVALAYPHQTDIIGKSLWDTKDINGTYFIRDLFESAKDESKRGHTFSFIIAISASLVVAACTAGIAYLIEPLLDTLQGKTPRATPFFSFEELAQDDKMALAMMLMIIGVYFGKSVGTYIQTYFMNLIGQDIVRQLRRLQSHQIPLRRIL